MMTFHYPNLGGASDWSYREGNLFQPIRSTTQIWVVTRYQYGKVGCGLFSQAITLRSCYSPWLKSSCVPSPTAADLHTIVEELPAAWTEATADS